MRRVDVSHLPPSGHLAKVGLGHLLLLRPLGNGRVGRRLEAVHHALGHVVGARCGARGVLLLGLAPQIAVRAVEREEAGGRGLWLLLLLLLPLRRRAALVGIAVDGERIIARFGHGHRR